MKTTFWHFAIAGTVIAFMTMNSTAVINASTHSNTAKIRPPAFALVSKQQHTPAIPVGQPAIAVKAGTTFPSGGPAFSAGDATRYVTSHHMWRSLPSQTPTTVLQVIFASSKDTKALLGGVPTEQPDDVLLCFVKVSGTFTFGAPHQSVSSHVGYEVFNALTGNLLMLGTLHDTTQGAYTARPAKTFAMPLASTAPSTLRCEPAHCYGVQIWPPGAPPPAQIEGAQTSISVVSLFCGGIDCQNDNGFLDNEEWVQSNGSFCGTLCPWVEGGYSTFGSGSAETLDYFYAYSTDGSSKPCCYHEYVLGQVDAVDYGTSTTVQIERGGSNYFNVTITTSTGKLYGVGTGTTPELANEIQIGQEAAWVDTDTQGPEAWFTNNIWFDGSYHQHYQTSLGSFAGANPPFVGWYNGQTPLVNNTGGVLYTYYPKQS